MTTIAESVHMFLLYQISRGGVKQKKKMIVHMSLLLTCILVYIQASQFFYRLRASLLAGPAVACALGCVRERVHPSTFHLFTGVQDMWQRGCHRATGCLRSRSDYYKTLVRLLLLLPVEENQREREEPCSQWPSNQLLTYLHLSTELRVSIFFRFLLLLLSFRSSLFFFVFMYIHFLFPLFRVGSERTWKTFPMDYVGK